MHTTRFAALAIFSVIGMVVAKSCARDYIVQLGDTCDSISAANNVSTWVFISDDIAVTSLTHFECSFQLASTDFNINHVGGDCQGLYSGEVLAFSRPSHPRTELLLQLLCLGLTGLDCTQTHVVQSGDYCASIADAAGINMTTLLYNNPNVAADCSNIYLDEVCLISRPEGGGAVELTPYRFSVLRPP
jgi:hypothetical protein